MNHGSSSSTLPLTLATTVAQIEKLQTDRRYRDRTRSFFVEGIRNFVKAVEQGYAISTIIFSERLLTAPIARKLVRQLRRDGVPTLAVTPEQFRAISRTERASGVSAIAQQRWSPLQQISPEAGLCWIVLEEVRSPGNLGTLIRTSEAFGGAGFILLGNGIDPFAPDVVRASMGALYRQQFVRTDFEKLQRWVSNHGCVVVGASPDGEVEIHRFDYPRATLLFLGEERKGLNSAQRNLCQKLVRIPMIGTADSLNLAVAGSLLLYEMHRAKS